MRVHIVLFALASTPLLAGAAQDRAAAVQEAGKCEIADANRSPTSWSREHRPDPKGRDRTGCSPISPAPLPPPRDSQPPPPAGTASIRGTAYVDATGYARLSGWVIQLTGTVTASAVTDGSGNYLFPGLPGGTYTICEVVQSGWSQTWPTFGTACSTGGYGYTFTLSDGQRGEFVDFGNVFQ